MKIKYIKCRLNIRIKKIIIKTKNNFNCFENMLYFPLDKSVDQKCKPAFDITSDKENENSLSALNSLISPRSFREFYGYGLKQGHSSMQIEPARTLPTNSPCSRLGPRLAMSNNFEIDKPKRIKKYISLKDKEKSRGKEEHQKIDIPASVIKQRNNERAILCSNDNDLF